MTGNGNGSKDFVTMRDLDAKLDKLRWEVRFLILAGLVAGQVLPAQDVARAAIGVLPW